MTSFPSRLQAIERISYQECGRSGAVEWLLYFNLEINLQVMYESAKFFLKMCNYIVTIFKNDENDNTQ